MARHMMVSKVRGRFDTFEAQIITAEDPLQSAATATVDMNSVNTGNETRDSDLRSDNFFAAGTYPAMTYRSTGIHRHGQDFIIDGERLLSHGNHQPQFRSAHAGQPQFRSAHGGRGST